MAENAKLAEEHAKNPPKEVKQDVPNMKMGFAPKQNLDNAKPNFVPQQNWSNNQNSENQGEKRAPRKRSMAYIENEENLIYKGYRDTKDPKDVKIINLSPEQPGVIIKGKISNYDSRETKNGGFLISFDIYDGTSSINVKAFLKANEFSEVNPKMKSVKAVRLVGTYEYNTFSKEFGVIADSLEETTIEEHIRMDNSEEKRVELHMHTQMSTMDGMTSATDLIKGRLNGDTRQLQLQTMALYKHFQRLKSCKRFRYQNHLWC